MKKRLISCLSALMLVSCSTHIQLSCTTPSCVGLVKGSKLEIQAGNSDVGRRIQQTLIEELQRGDFYTICDSGDYVLTLTDSKEHTWGSLSSTPFGDDELEGTTEIETRISLSSRENNIYGYSQAYSVSSDGMEADVEMLCHNIAQDLQPHRLLYREKLTVPAHNPSFVQAVDCAQGGVWQLAHQHATQATLQSPLEPEVHYLLGLIERQLGHFEASDACFRQAHQLKADARYTEAIELNKLMRKGLQNARFQLNLKEDAPFNPKTLPAYHKSAGNPWTQVFFPMNLQNIPR